MEKYGFIFGLIVIQYGLIWIIYGLPSDKLTVRPWKSPIC